MTDRAEPTISNALKVIVHDPIIRAFLETHDPKALAQAKEALALEETQRQDEQNREWQEYFAKNKGVWTF